MTFLAAIDAASASASRSAAATSSKSAAAPLYPLAQLDNLTDDFLAAASVCLPDAEYQELAGGFVSIRSTVEASLSAAAAEKARAVAEAEKVHKAAADRYRFQVAGFKQQLEQALSLIHI